VSFGKLEVIDRQLNFGDLHANGARYIRVSKTSLRSE
jgi:hypothetical protein